MKNGLDGINLAQRADICFTHCFRKAFGAKVRNAGVAETLRFIMTQFLCESGIGGFTVHRLFYFMAKILAYGIFIIQNTFDLQQEPRVNAGNLIQFLNCQTKLHAFVNKQNPVRTAKIQFFPYPFAAGGGFNGGFRFQFAVLQALQPCFKSAESLLQSLAEIAAKSHGFPD